MAHFYGHMKGAKGETTRCGNKNSGIAAHIRGWNLGVRVEMSHDRDTGEDICTVVLTNGSNGCNSAFGCTKRVLGRFKASDLEPKMVQADMFK